VSSFIFSSSRTFRNKLNDINQKNPTDELLIHMKSSITKSDSLV